MSQGWDQEASGERKWNVLRKGMRKAAEVILGKWQPDWFQENIPNLEIFITVVEDTLYKRLTEICTAEKGVCM